MARPPGHRIELSEGERVVLERTARAEKLAFQDVQRARIVLYAAEGCMTPRSRRGWIRRPGWSGGGDEGSLSIVLKG
jgi:hypothetical protein